MANKLNRNDKKCAAYKAEGRREKNKARRLAKMLKGFRPITSLEQRSW